MVKRFLLSEDDCLELGMGRKKGGKEEKSVWFDKRGLLRFEKRVCVICCFSGRLFYALVSGVWGVGSALELFNSMCRYYRFNLVGGAPIVNAAELFKTDGLVGFGRQAGLEW